MRKFRHKSVFFAFFYFKKDAIYNYIVQIVKIIEKGWKFYP